MGAAFTSCSKDIAFDSEGFAKEAAQKASAEYEANFVKKYGQNALNQNWDFTTGQTYTSLPSSGSTRSITRGEGDYQKTIGSMIVEQEIIQWLVNNMKAGQNNFLKGSPFYMRTVEQSFTIVPVFQGTASYFWELWMSVEGMENDVLIWKKGDNLGWRAQGDETFTPAGTGTDGVNKNAYEVQGPTITFSNLPVGKIMYFYLKVWDSYNDYLDNNKNPRKMTSLDEMMLALENIDKPKNVPQDNMVTVIGCEDKKGSASDMDYEDLVFLMYGKPAPPIYHTDTLITEKTKRYMMEDLGTTDDFDFNDVVVDVSYDREQKITIYKNNAEGGWSFIRKETIESLPDQAIVRAAGGTLNFTLTIGSTTWKKSDNLAVSNMWNTGWGGSEISYTGGLEPFTVTGYNPSSNNISVTVQREGENQSGLVETIGFPKRGEAPKIIAVEASNNWMTERTSIPTSWFTE